MSLTNTITRKFDIAAQDYDVHASVQARIAHALSAWATPTLPPRCILDIGCGTGFASQAAAQKWPMAKIYALDPAPAMLIEALRKLPKLKIIVGDATRLEVTHAYDAIFSSMMLHWLPQPAAALKRWREVLNPDGRLYVALLIDGSFKEWRDLCALHDADDGLWKMPSADFGADISLRHELIDFVGSFPSAQEFLRHLKSIGAATPNPDHKPIGAGVMRKILKDSPQPFEVTYRALFLEITAAVRA